PDSDVRNSSRVKSHQPRTAGIRRHRVIGQDNSVERPRMSIQWSISFHCHNRIGDNEMNRNRSADIQNAFLNAFPMKDVLWPAVLRAWHSAKHVFHADGDTRPVMRLYLGHGNDEI